MNANTNLLAGLIGPTLIVLSISEAINFHIWTTNIPSLTYLNWLILFVAGLAIVRAHNLWTPAWPVLVSLTGWVLILGGLFRMFAPEAQQAGDNIATYAMLLAMLLIGSFLTFKAYWTRS